MKLNPNEFNVFLSSIGQDVTWRRAYACPCVNANSGQAKSNCRHCSGVGRIWMASVVARTGVSGGRAQKEWAQFGQWDSGDVVITIPSDSALYAIGPFDRVLFSNRSEPFSQNVVKGINEKVRFPVVSLESVIYIDGANLVNAPLPSVNQDGTLDWDAVALPDGVTFSITGRRRTEYYCFFEMPFDRPHHGGASLPRKVVLRRYELYGMS